MAPHLIGAFVFDEHNLAEMARHGVSGNEVEQLAWNRNVIVPNPQGKPGSLLVVGETNGGRLVTAPVAPTDDPTTWRPATAFDATRHQRVLFDRRHR